MMDSFSFSARSTDLPPRAFDFWPFWREKGLYKTNRPDNGKAPELDFCVLFLSHVDWDNEEGQTGQMYTERLYRKVWNNMNGREDTCKEKHIELHVRTGYSGMCGFGSPDPLPDNTFDYAVLRYNNGDTKTRYQGGRY